MESPAVGNAIHPEGSSADVADGPPVAHTRCVHSDDADALAERKTSFHAERSLENSTCQQNQLAVSHLGVSHGSPRVDCQLLINALIVHVDLIKKNFSGNAC
jgi:hypothetical protein